MKRCACCGERKPLDAFPFRSKPRRLRYSYCRECHKLKSAARYEALGPEGKNARQQRYYPTSGRAALLRRFGITKARYEAMLGAQGGVCAICGRAESMRVRRNGTRMRALQVDHSHATNRVRGLLCSDCNIGLSKFGVDEARLTAAIAYLRKHLAAAPAYLEPSA